MTDQLVTLDLGDGLKIVVAPVQQGAQMVAADDFVGRLSTVTDSMEIVAKKVLDALKKAVPDKATVEISFGLAVEQGQLLALLGKGKAEGAITATLEWSRKDTDAPDVSADETTGAGATP